MSHLSGWKERDSPEPSVFARLNVFDTIELWTFDTIQLINLFLYRLYTYCYI